MNNFDYQIIKAMLLDRQVYEDHSEALSFKEVYLHNIFEQIKLYYLHNSTIDSITIKDITNVIQQLYKDNIYILILEDINSTEINKEYIEHLTLILHNRHTIYTLKETVIKLIEEQSFDNIEPLQEILSEPISSSDSDISTLSLQEITSFKDGLSWPWEVMNKSLGRIPESTHGILAARVEVGKTAFIVNCILHFLSQGATVLHVNNEDPIAKLLERYYMIYWGVDGDTIKSKLEKCSEEFSRIFKNQLFILDSSGLYTQALGKKIALLSPDFVVVDQLDDMTKDKDPKSLEILYSATRNLAKKHNTRILSVTQASAGDSTHLDMNDLYGSKVGKPASADYIITLGKNAYGYQRYIFLPKNKLTGKHDKFELLFDPVTMRMVE